MINEKLLPQIEDLTTKITFNETVGDACRFLKQGNLVIMFFQGASKAHSPNDLLATIPVAYRPKERIFLPFVKMGGNVVGTLGISNNDGKIVVNQISNTSTSGRVYANCVYSIK